MSDILQDLIDIHECTKEVHFNNEWPFALSFSKLSTSEQCLYKFWLQYGSKHVEGKARLKFKGSTATERGSDIHSVLEQGLRLLYNNKSLAPLYYKEGWLDRYEKLLRQLRSKFNDVIVEKQLAIASDFTKTKIGPYYKPLDAKKPPMFQGALDAVFTKDVITKSKSALIIDWKTGKIRIDPSQLLSQVLLLHSFLSNLHNVSATFVFIDHDYAATDEAVNVDMVNDIFDLRVEFAERFLPVFKAIVNNKYPKTPNHLCNWCDAKKEGLCDGK